MSQEKTEVPGFNGAFASGSNNRMYSRTSANYGGGNRGTVVPGMENVAPGVKNFEANDGNSSPVVGFLYSISRQGIGEYWPVHLGTNKIGRSDECDVCLRESTVSELHAELYVKQMKTTKKILASIKDVGSKNGIFVNEEELGYSTHECFNNDILTIGLNYKLLLIIIDANEMGLSVAEEFEAIDDEPVIMNQPNKNFSNTFNPYDHNNRPSNNGTVAMDGSQNTRPGGTKYM